MTKKSNNSKVAIAVEEAKTEQCNLAGIKTKRKRPINLNDKVKTLAIKVYDEQIPIGWEALKRIIKKIDKKQYHVIGILHNRDNVSTDAFEISLEKPHYHIIVRTANTHTKNVRVSTVLKMLHINYRQDEDRILWENHGVELVGDYNIYTLYLLHETVQAQLDLKAPYDIEELVSNLTRAEIENLLTIGRQAEKPSATKIAELQKEAFDRGYNLLDWTEWYRELPEKIKGHKNMRLILEEYQFGVEKRIAENNRVIRTCIFIMGEPNKGKTTAIRLALGNKKIEEISAGKTGQFDSITPTTEAIILNDNATTNLQNLCDDNMCKLYRRNNGNPYWCGDVFVATSNVSFEEWVEDCGVKTRKKVENKDWSEESDEPKFFEVETAAFRAIKSRFFICHLEEIGGASRLILDSVAARGSQKSFNERLEKFKRFQQKFNEVIATYIPGDYRVNLDEINYTQAELKEMYGGDIFEEGKA